MESLLNTSPILHIVDKINELVSYANSDKELLDGFRNADNSIYNETIDKININGYIHTVKMAGLYKITLTATSGSLDLTVHENNSSSTYATSLDVNNLVLENVLLLNGDYVSFIDRSLPSGSKVSIELQKNLVKSIFDSVTEVKTISTELTSEIEAVLELSRNYEIARQELAASKIQYENGLVALDIARRELESKSIVVNETVQSVANLTGEVSTAKANISQAQADISNLSKNKADKTVTADLQVKKADKTELEGLKKATVVAKGTTNFSGVANDTLIFVRYN